MILFLLACFDNSTRITPSNSRTNPVSQSDGSSVKVQLFDNRTPLKRPEVHLDQWSADLIKDLTHPEETIALGNLFRAPCQTEFEVGYSLAESVSFAKCSKSIDWITFLDTKLLTNTVDDILSNFAVPGPYWGDAFAEPTVFVHDGGKERNLVFLRIQQLKLSVRIVEHKNGKLTNTLMCDGQKMTSGEGAPDKNCYNVVSSEGTNPYQPFLNSPYAESSPVWFINGYSIRGLQSVRTLQLYQMMP